jgi:hypothetical protein
MNVLPWMRQSWTGGDGSSLSIGDRVKETGGSRVGLLDRAWLSPNGTSWPHVIWDGGASANMFPDLLAKSTSAPPQSPPPQSPPSDNGNGGGVGEMLKKVVPFLLVGGLILYSRRKR